MKYKFPPIPSSLYMNSERSDPGNAGQSFNSGPAFPEPASNQHEVDYAENEMNDSDGKTPGEKKKKKKKKDKETPVLGSQRGVETMFRTSYQQHVDLSALADNKANIMITINGIIISIVLASISPKIDANPWLLIPTSTLLVSCLISIIYAVLAARPRVNTRPVAVEDIKSDRANILFFSNFVNMREEDYVDGMTGLLQDTNRLYKNMIRDIYGLGHVLARKFRLLRVSYLVFIIGLSLGVLLYIGVFVGIVTTLPTTTVVTTPVP